MGRLHADFLERVESFCDRVVGVGETLSRQGRSRRIVDQIMACGTSVGANVFEADEAMSTADFRKCLAIAVKEINETRFWLRLCVRRGWITAVRLTRLEQETAEIKLILGSILTKTRPAGPARKRLH